MEGVAGASLKGICLFEVPASDSITAFSTDVLPTWAPRRLAPVQNTFSHSPAF